MNKKLLLLVTLLGTVSGIKTMDYSEKFVVCLNSCPPSTNDIITNCAYKCKINYLYTVNSDPKTATKANNNYAVCCMSCKPSEKNCFSSCLKKRDAQHDCTKNCFTKSLQITNYKKRSYFMNNCLAKCN